MKRIYSGVEVTYQNETDYLQSNVVYLITFPNGKYYVGSTTREMTTRISTHCSHAIITNKLLLSSFAIRKFMKFEVKILDTEIGVEELRKLEGDYTNEYKSNEEEFGYNENTGFLRTEKHKLKMSQCHKSKVISDETKFKMSESHGQPFFDDFNNYFRSTYHAAEYYKCCHSTIFELLKSGKTSKKLGTSFRYVQPIV